MTCTVRGLLVLVCSVLLLGWHGTVVDGKTVFVDLTCPPTQCVLAQAQPCCTNIKSAVAVVSSFDTIRIAAGEYTGPTNTDICDFNNVRTRTCNFTGVSMIGQAPGLVSISGAATRGITHGMHIADSSFALIANISFHDFNLSQSSSAGGVFVVENTTSLILDNLYFHDNSNLFATAIYASRSEIFISNSQFENNRAFGYGGAIGAIDCNLTVSKSIFFNNSASTFDTHISADGGAIAFRANNALSLYITDTVFIANSAQRTGGAISIESKSFVSMPTTVFISRCSFESNEGTGQGSCASTSSCDTLGGAIYVNAGNLTIKDNTFTNNAVKSTDNFNVGQGGAIFIANVLGTDHNGLANILGCNFTGNSAVGIGGALAVLNQRIAVQGCRFISNVVSTMSPYFADTPAQGGALWLSAQSTQSTITKSWFLNNTALSGWGGGVYLTGTALLTVDHSYFSHNSAISSYTNSGQGGAIMASYGTSLTLSFSRFLFNKVLPRVALVPQTYSGEGGGVFAQSSSVFIDNCEFTLNYAMTGQFDAGAYGGGLLLEDCYPAVITKSKFRGNSALGYFGRSTFASSGTGGGIYIKFSAAQISDCEFDQNFVSAGGSQNGIGGGIAVNFDYSSVSGSIHGVSINNTVFNNNSAYAQFCYYTQAGQGAALGIVGAHTPALTLNSVNFTHNKAQSEQTSNAFSTGAAITMSQASNVSAHNCRFEGNVAYFGIGNDISSLSGENEENNELYLENSYFLAASADQANTEYAILVSLSTWFCSQLQQCVDKSPDCLVLDHGEFHSDSQRRRAQESTPVDDSLHAFKSVPGLQHWLRVVIDEKTLSVVLFDTHAITVMENALLQDKEYTEKERDHLVLTNVIRALANFAHENATGLSKGEEKTLTVLIQELKSIEMKEFAKSEKTSKNGLYGKEQVVEEEQEEEDIDLFSMPYTHQLERSHRQLASSPKSDLTSFTTYRPDVVLTSGLTRFVNPYFEGSYYVFCGDYSKVYSAKTVNGLSLDVDPDSVFFSETSFYGDIYGDDLTLTIVSSNVSLHMPTAIMSPLAIKQLNIFNATFKLSNNLNVMENSYFYEAKVVGVPNMVSNYYLVPFPHRPHKGRIIFTSSNSTNSSMESISANITFYRNLLTGYQIEQLAGKRNFAKSVFLYYLKNSTDSNSSVLPPRCTTMTFEGVAIVIQGEMYLDSPFRSIAVKNSSRWHTNDGDELSPTSTTTISDLLSDPNTEYLSNAKVFLSRNATVIINEGGSLKLITASIIQNQEDCSLPIVINYGNVSLMGISGNFFSQETRVPTPQRAARVAAYGSLTSTLSVTCGELFQYETGSLNIVLNASLQTHPVLYLQSNAYLSGALSVDFFSTATEYDDDNVFTTASSAQLSLYDAPVSSFEVIKFSNFSSSVGQSLNGLPAMAVAAPQGLKFFSTVAESSSSVTLSSMSRRSLMDRENDENENAPRSLRVPHSLSTKRQRDVTQSSLTTQPSLTQSSLITQSTDDTSSANVSYFQTLTVANIGCAHVADYYAGYSLPQSSAPLPPSQTFYNCYICLSNSSCELCNSGFCAVKGQCGAHGVQYSGTCCSPSCQAPYGHCTESDDHTNYECRCYWFYQGADCQKISTEGIITIFSGVFVVVVLALSLFLYRRVIEQRKKVLEELKEGILRHTESHNNEYIQTMQQALILNDVFVKWEEIKIESQIGEGSFGVVHKATFRGAQVAVKQMRSMFLELTEKDIEEFRKEAYMMSRLRHPNIVLVMGISLVDQEPLPLPTKTRSTKRLSPSDEAELSPFMDGTSGKDKKKVLQKTVCIITEYLEQGSLADILYGPTRLPAEIWTYELILTCALQAARGMLYLHSHHPPICHRDLKSSNLVVDDHWVVKVTDFGMSRIVPEKLQEAEQHGVNTAGGGDVPGFARDDEERDSLLREQRPSFLDERDATERERGERDSTCSFSSPYANNTTRLSISALSAQNPIALEMTSNLGTTAWCAPELLTASSKTRYSVKVDVYSFGMVLWELWEKKRPFEEFSSRFDIMDAVRSGKRPIISDSCPPTFKSLITRCWHTEPSRRPTFNYIVRYLKDELARVKRNKTLSTTTLQSGALSSNASMTSASTAHSTAQYSTGLGGGRSSLMSAYFRPSFSSAVQQGAQQGAAEGGAASATVPTGGPMGPAGLSHSSRNLQHSNQSTSSRVSAQRRSSGANKSLQSAVRAALTPSSSASNLAAMATPTPVSGNINPNGAAAGGALNPMHNASYANDAKADNDAKTPSAEVPIPLPQSRTALVKAVDRSLSYLAESPAMGSPLNAPSQQGPGGAPHSALSQGGAAAKYNASQVWRDRYVMRFSGWKSSNPDAGLPPPRATATATSASSSSQPRSVGAPAALSPPLESDAAVGVASAPVLVPAPSTPREGGERAGAAGGGAVGGAQSVASSPSRTTLAQSMTATSLATSPGTLLSASVDSQPMFPLEQEPIATSMTLRKAKSRQGTDLVDEEHENESM